MSISTQHVPYLPVPEQRGPQVRGDCRHTNPKLANWQTGQHVTSVRVGGRWVPVEQVGLAVDELEVVWALRVAVAGAVLGAPLVARVLGFAAVLVHLHEVQRAVEAARHLGHVNIEGELSILEMEHVIAARWARGARKGGRGRRKNGRARFVFHLRDGLEEEGPEAGGLANKG